MIVTACTATTALGAGIAPLRRALHDRISGLSPVAFAGVARGQVGPVPGIGGHALPPDLRAWDCRNNRLADLALRQDGFLERVGAVRARYGAGRVALVLGTSTSGVLSGEDAYAAARAAGDGAPLPAGFDHRRTQDLHALAGYVQRALRLDGPALVVSTACSSSARAFLDAASLVRAGFCDAAVVGGADSLCRLTLSGFAALDLVSPGRCRPCDADRDGVSIGEAAGFAILEPDPGAVPDGAMALLGGGGSSDGHHMSTPHPEGDGAAAAMRAALAGRDAPGHVLLHGTGTVANDRAEDRAVAAVLGTAVPCGATKAHTGHTLGACGIVAAATAMVALRDRFLPACLGVARVDPGFRCRVLTANAPTDPRTVLCNAFGFGGSNCALLFGRAA